MTDAFEEKAKNWDDNPGRVEMSKIFTEEIKKHFDINSKPKILDFGCGTGLVGLNFASFADSLFMVDMSASMLAVLKQKVMNSSLKNIEIIEGEIDYLKIGDSSVDLIVSLMAFHHVKDMSHVLTVFHRLIKRDGRVIIGDLYKEDGSFHYPEIVEHNGFDLDDIKTSFEKNNFSVRSLYKYNFMTKKLQDGTSRNYEQFILVAQAK